MIFLCLGIIESLIIGIIAVFFIWLSEKGSEEEEKDDIFEE